MQKNGVLDIEVNAADNFPEFLAWLKILRVTAMHRVADTFGPIIYTKFGQVNADGSIEFDCLDVAYDAFFQDLSDAIRDLDAYQAANPGNEPFEKFDEVYFAGETYRK